MHPGARRAVGSAIWNGAFLIHGGFGLDGSTTPDAVAADTWAWRGDWQRLGETGPPAARYPSLCSVPGGLLRFGGCGSDGQGGLTFLDETWRWDGTAWTAVQVETSRPEGRYTSALALSGHGVVMFGGHSQTLDRAKTFYGDLWCLHDATWRRIHGPEIGPGPRYGFGWAAAKDTLYLFGGFDGASDRADFWQLDLESLEWRRLPDGPSARYCPALGIAEDRVVLFGGRSKSDSKHNLADTWIFDGAWQEHSVDGGPCYHAKSAYASDGHRMFLYAGEGPRGHVSDLWCFEGDAWSLESPALGDDPVLW